MASIKVKFRPSSVAEREGTIYYQIIHERKPRQLLSDYKVYPYEWDEARSLVIINENNVRRPLLLSIRDRIRYDIERFGRIIRRLDRAGIAYTSDDVIDEYRRYTYEYNLFNFMERIIINLKQNGKVRTAETYTAALRSFRNFLEEYAAGDTGLMGDILIDILSSEMMEAYQAWQQQRGLALNTISFYLRILRAVYNRAVENELVDNRHPFRHVYTGVDKTTKRALPLKIIKRIKGLDLSCSAALDSARDIFILSFMLRGMSFIDMAYLRKTDLKDGHIIYRRRKTGQQLTIEWTAEMQQILDKYPENESGYLLPIIRHKGINERCAYKNAGYNINHNLKRIAEKIGLSVPLTLYVARHSWASAARAKGIPLPVISEGMGHDSEKTTLIYLAGLDTSAVDKANALIISCL